MRILRKAARSAALFCAAAFGLSAWAATPLAVWNGDFNDAATRNGVTFSANNNTINADGTVTIASGSTTGISFNLPATYDYVTAVFTVTGVTGKTAANAVLVSTKSGNSAYGGVYVKSGSLGTGGINGTTAWSITSADGTITSYDDTNTTDVNEDATAERTFAVTQVNSDRVQNGMHLFEIVGGGTDAKVVFGSNGNNGLRYALGYNVITIGGFQTTPSETGAIGTMEGLTLKSVAIYASNKSWPLDGTGRANFAMPLAFNISGDTSLSTINAVAANYTDNVFVNFTADGLFLTADAGAASNVILPYDTTATVTDDTLALAGDLPVKLGSGITAVTGSGVIVAVGATEIDTLPSGAFSSDAWTGTVWLKGRTGWTNIVPTNYGNAGSTLRFSGISGYFAKAQYSASVSPAFELENDSYDYGYTITDGYSFNPNGGYSYFQTKTLKGSGSLISNAKGGGLISVTENWDEFTGSINLSNRTIWLGFTDAPSSSSSTDTTLGVLGGTVRLNNVDVTPGAAWTFASNGGFIGTGTVHLAYPWYGTANCGTNSRWEGTIELAAYTASQNVAINLSYMGNANSTIVLKGIASTASTNAGPYIEPANGSTVTATVQLDGDVTFGAANSGKTQTLNKITGTGNLNFFYTGSHTYNILDVSGYTGTIAAKSSSTVYVGVPTAPAVGDLIAKVDSTNNKVSTSVYYDGLSGGLSGELTTVDDVYGLYATAAATIGETSYPTFAAALDAAEEGDTITLSRTINETSVSVDKDLTLAVANNNVYLNLDSIAISEGKTLTFSGFNKAITVGAITGGGNIVSTGGNTFNLKFSGGTYEMASITTAKGLQFQGYGDVTVSGDVTVNGNFTLIPDAANTTSIAKGYTFKVTANSVDAEALYGGGTIATTEGTTVAGGAFYGKINGPLTASGNFVMRNSNDIDTLTVADGKTVTIGNHLEAMTNIRFELDATDSTTYTDDGEGNITAFKGRGDNTYTLESGATAAVLNSGDATHFGGKPYIQFSSSKYARGSKVSARSYIAVTHPDAAGGYIAYYSNQDMFGPSTTAWFARCFSGNIDSYLFQNGTSDRTFTADADTIVSLCARITASNNREDHIGTSFTGAIGELIGFTSEISIEDRTACEMYLMNKWNLAAAANFRPLPDTADVVTGTGSTLDLGGYTLTVNSFTGGGAVQNGTLYTSDNTYTNTGALAINAVDNMTIVLDAGATALTLTGEATGVKVVATEAFIASGATVTVTATDTTPDFTELPTTIFRWGVTAGDAGTWYVGAETTFSAATYTWTGVSDSDWSNIANWSVTGYASVAALPQSVDTVVFPASVEEEFAGWTVELDSMPTVGAVVVNGDTSFSGARIQVANGETSAVTGTGTITLGDDAGFYPGGGDDLSLTVENNLKITAGENAPAKVQGRIVKSSSGGATVRVNGNLTGTGWVEFGGTRSSTYLNGDNTEFAGHATFPDDAALAGARRLNVYFEDTSAVSPNAVWTVYNHNGNPLTKIGTQYCYCFGALFGEFNNTMASSRAASWVELGGANIDFDVIFKGVDHGDRRDKVRKVGTGVMTLNAGSSNISELVLNGGTLVITNGVSYIPDNVTTELEGYEVVATPTYDTEDPTKVLYTTYTLAEVLRIDPAAVTINYNSYATLSVAGYPEGATFGWTMYTNGVACSSMSGPVKISSGKNKATVKVYSETTAFDSVVAKVAITNGAEVTVLEATITVADVAAKIGDTEYGKAELDDAIAAAIESGDVLEHYLAVSTTITKGQTLKTKKLAERNGTASVKAAASTTAGVAWTIAKSEEDGVITWSVVTETPYFEFTSADSQTVEYLASPKNAAGTNKLLSDATITKQFSVTKDGVVLDLNGHALTSTYASNSAGAVYVNVISPAPAALTVKDSVGGGSIAAASAHSVFMLGNNGQLTVEGGSFTGKHIVYGTKTTSVATITGGTFEASDAGYTLNMLDSARGTITVTGGTFTGFNPANNSAEGAGTNFVPNGYVSTETSTGVWTVAKSGIDPTDPTSSQEVTPTAEEIEAAGSAEEAAIAAATVTVPEAVSGVVDAATYKGYFKLAAVETSAGSGVYTVTIAGFADVVTETANANALEALEAATAGDTLSSEVAVKPGLYYSTVAGANVTTLKAPAGTLNTTGSLDLSGVTKPSTGAAYFIKIRVGATAFAAEE